MWIYYPCPWSVRFRTTYAARGVDQHTLAHSALFMYYLDF